MVARVAGFYWVSLGGGDPEVAHYVDDEWWVTGSETPVVHDVTVLNESRLEPPDLLETGPPPVSIRPAG